MKNQVNTIVGIQNSRVILHKLKYSLSTYNCSTHHTTLPQKHLKEILKRTPLRENSPNLACNETYVCVHF